MKKESVSISNGTLKGYEDPLRRFAPKDKSTDSSTSSEYEFKHAEEAHTLLKQYEIESHSSELKAGGSSSGYYTIWGIINIVSFIVLIYCESKDIDDNWTWLLSLLNVYAFFKLFFVGVGKPDKNRRRCNASQVLLLTIFFGLYSLYVALHFAYEYSFSDSEIGLVLIGGFVLWILALILAIFNKIQVNVHNQD